MNGHFAWLYILAMLKSGNFLTFFAPVKGTSMNYNYKLIMVSMLFFASSIDCLCSTSASIIGSCSKKIDNNSLDQFYERHDQFCTDHVDNPIFQEGYRLVATLIEPTMLDKRSWKVAALKKEVEEKIAKSYLQIFPAKKMGDKDVEDKLSLFRGGIYAKLREICTPAELAMLINKCDNRCGLYGQMAYSPTAILDAAIADMHSPESEELSDLQYLAWVKETMAHFFCRLTPPTFSIKK